MTKQNTGKGLAVHATSCSAWARSAPSIAAAPQQAGREGPQEAFAVLAQRSGASHGEGFYPVRHEDLHARGPRMKINQPKCMCRASQGKGGMRGTCADAKISLGDAFLYGAIALIG